jgi:hypothetical protein
MVKPDMGDLLGTTITNIAPSNKNVVNTWAGQDYGAVSAGYTNNAALGRLVLDGLGANSTFTFDGVTNGVGATNALYVDSIEFRDYATNRDLNGNLTALSFNTNLVIYYAQAIIAGQFSSQSVAEKLNGANGGHLIWVPSYAGPFSGTNIVYPDGTTNTFNAALVQSSFLDSDGDGIVNKNDPTPFFVSSEVNFNVTTTNLPSPTVFISWNSIPDATNLVSYKTNLLSADWLTLTNFVTPSAPPYAPVTNVVADPMTLMPHYYRVRVDLNTTDLYGF